MMPGASTTCTRTFGRPLVIALTVLAAAGSLLTATPARADQCANADISPVTPQQLAAAERATRCLVNVERRRHHLRPVRYNHDLFESSSWQAQDMAANAYFDHQRAGGPGFADRITRFGYGAGSNGYALGENLAWSTDGSASPREIVKMWMQSQGHRENILRRQFKDQAVVALMIDGDQVGGDYAGNGPLVIYVNQFGARF